MSDAGKGQPLPEDVLLRLANEDAEGLRNAIRENPALLQTGVVAQFADAVRQYLRVDTELALRLAEASVFLAQQLQDADSLGLSLRAKANALWFRNDLRSATDFFEEAVSWFEKAGREEEIGRTLSSSIQSFSLLGEYDRALHASARARRIFETVNDGRRLARLDINTANIYHRQDKFAEALSMYQRAYQQLLPFKDSEGLSVALHNIAVCLIMLNKFEEAISTIRLVRELCGRDMPLLSRQAEYNIAYLHFLRGDYDEALATLRTTRALCQHDGDAYHEALCDLDESEICLELNLARDAARLAKQAIQQFSGLAMSFEQGRSTVNLAVASHRLGDSQTPLSLLQNARAIFEREGNEAWLALVAVYEAIVLLDARSFRQARTRCKQALRFFTSVGLERREILCELVLVRILLAMSQVSSARDLCETALSKLTGIEAPQLRFQAYLLMGHISAGESEEVAYAFYEKARVESEALRGRVQGDELKIAFMRDKEEVYQRLVQLCLKRPTHIEAAFHHIEQAKSQALVDMVLGRAMPVPVSTGESVRVRLEALRRELNWYYHRLEIEQNPKERLSPERVSEVREAIVAREEEFVRLLRNAWATSGDRMLPGRDTMPLATIRRSLTPETTLVEYFQVDKLFVAAVVTLDSIQIVPVADVAAVDESLHMLEFQMARMRIAGTAADTEHHLLRAVNNRLRYLYEQVFAPISAQVRTKELVIVPHGVLHRLPFHALIAGQEHLIDRFTISYAPSASIYATCESRKVNVTGSSLLLGVPDEMAPWIEEEVESVASVVPGARRFIGPNVTHSLLQEEGRTARLIHIATHGIFRGDNALFSAVRLADGYLNLHDLYQLRLPAELITLSGCGTGLSEVAAGDELVGLTRGLLYAGARSVVVTLWDIHDRITARFMRAFYCSLFANGDKALAIHTAMLEVRDECPHPYYWAPFLLIGSRRCLQNS